MNDLSLFEVTYMYLNNIFNFCFLCFVIYGFVLMRRRPILKRLTVVDYPGVDPVKFLEWQRTELTYTDILLWTLLATLTSLIFAAICSIATNSISVIKIFVVFIWLICLVIAATFGMKAKKIRVSAGIQWPKKAGKEAIGSKNTK